MKNKLSPTKKEFIAGTILAAEFFLIWNFITQFYGITWQQLLVSLLYGGYVVLAHKLMKGPTFLKTISYFMLIIPCILGLLWLMFCYDLSQFHL